MLVVVWDYIGDQRVIRRFISIMCFKENQSDAKLCLTKGLRESYESVTEAVLNVKSGFISLCADIDRYIRLTAGCEIGEEMDEASIERLRHLYPLLNGLTTDQWKRLMTTFSFIRNDSAHLYQNKAVYLDRSVQSYLEGLVKPEMRLMVNGNELTIYGAYYVLSFLAQKYQLFPFVSNVINKRNFGNMSRKEMTKFTVSTVKLHAPYCGKGKPIGLATVVGLGDATYVNDTLRRHLSKVFLGLEAVAFEHSQASTYSPSFREILSHVGCVAKDKELYDDLVELRNVWFHGHTLGDEVRIPNKPVKTFDLFETIKTLKRLEEAIIDSEEYDYLTEQIATFGESLLFFKCLRLVELSYKVLDSRVLEREKLDERVKNLAGGYKIVTSASDYFYKEASSLILSGPLDWKVVSSKFSSADCRPRVTSVDELKIITMHSENGFDIGGYHTNEKTLTLCDVTIPYEFSLTINGKRLSDYSLVLERDICPRVKVYRAEL